MNRFLIAGAITAAALGLAARGAPTPRVAVVDMSRLVGQNRQSREEQLLIQQWYETSMKLLDESQRKYKEQVDELDQFKTGSDEYRKRSKELRVRKFELETEYTAINDEHERRIGRSIADSHGRVVAACRTYLESADLDLVLQYASSPVNGAKSAEVIPEIVVRNVVAHRKALDATDAVLAILDAGK